MTIIYVGLVACLALFLFLFSLPALQRCARWDAKRRQQAQGVRNAQQWAIQTAQEKLWEEELQKIRAQRDNNTRLHGATAVRNNAHKATCEAEIPVPGYVPVWAYNGIMSVIIYVAPDNVDGRAEERRQKAERAAWEASKMGRAVSVATKTVGWAIAAPFILLLLSPFILVACLFVGWIGFSTVCLIIAIMWFMSDFKKAVAEEVLEGLKTQSPK